MKHFIHSGDFGDLIYSLPTVWAMGGGAMHLIHTPGMTAHGMGPERVWAIRPLLLMQSYIHDVSTEMPTANVIDLNDFRRRGHNFCCTNLIDCHARTFIRENPDQLKFEKWLSVYHPRFFHPVIIARSARYHNPRFPWKRVMEKYGRYAAFVGTPAEHVAFVTEFGDIPHFHTRDLEDVANIIAGAGLFVGNQSCPLAIAEGLKKRIVIEECPHCPNCKVNRPGVVGTTTDQITLPEIEENHAFQERSAAAVHAHQPS